MMAAHASQVGGDLHGSFTIITSSDTHQFLKMINFACINRALGHSPVQQHHCYDVIRHKALH